MRTGRKSAVWAASLLLAGSLGPTARTAVAQNAPPNPDRVTLSGAAPVAQAVTPEATLASLLGSGAGAPVAPGNDHLLLDADTLTYNLDNNIITATGNVAISYRGYSLFAHQVTLNRKTNEFIASNGVRLEQPDGAVIVARSVRLDETLRNGFIEGLRLDTINRTRFAAATAQRVNGNTTIFTKGVYTACYDCLAHPDQPPIWQIKARKIIHNQAEQTLRYEGARLEFWGVPIAYLPFLSTPDPTVRRKSGFLLPTALYSNLLGAGARVPYYYVLSPYSDLTVGVTGLTKQGVLGDAEYRQRLINGSYDIRAAGIWQASPGEFAGTSGDRRFRGMAESAGLFRINPEWTWGWQTTLTTDRSFLHDYKLTPLGGYLGPDDLTAVSTLYLDGLGVRKWFDARLYYFRVLQEDYTGGNVIEPPYPFTPVGQDLQDKQPYVGLIDYDGVLDRRLLGGELSYQLNATSLTRTETDAVGAYENGLLVPRFRGVEGTFSRQTAEVEWRRRFIDPLGEVFTPFAGFQGDLFEVDNRDPNVTALSSDATYLRAMPWIGLEYRWPWVAASTWGTQTIEPIAQLIVRPDEAYIGHLPNEDAQSIVFDDTTLFQTDKFSGFDRVEGGTRLNVGFHYTAQTFAGGFLSALAGESFQLAGKNSYAVPDILDSTAGSGLATAESDYVAGLYLDTNLGLQAAAQARFDNQTFALNRAEFQVSGQTGPFSSRVTYAFLKARPDLGIPNDQQGIQGDASVRLLRNWRLFGEMQYDLQSKQIVTDGVGIGYDDDCLSVSLAYAVDRSGAPELPADQTVFLRIGLRTLGDTGGSTSLGQ